MKKFKNLIKVNDNFINKNLLNKKRDLFYCWGYYKLGIVSKIKLSHKYKSKLFLFVRDFIANLYFSRRSDFIAKKRLKGKIYKWINYYRKFLIAKNFRKFNNILHKKLKKLKKNKRYRHYTYLVYGKKRPKRNRYRNRSRRKKKIYKSLKHIKKFFRKYKKKLLYENKHKKKAIIHFKPSYSNYFITLTDLSYNVIKSYSGGTFCLSNNKKQKMSTIVCTNILKHMFVYLKFYKIKAIKMEIKKRFDSFFYQTLRFLKWKKIKVLSFSLVKRMPHNLGQRKRKIRRV